MDKIWEAIKLYFQNHAQHEWLEHHFFYFALLGIAIVTTLFIIYMKKIQKEIDASKKDSRKKRKDFLKATSTKKNTTR